MKLEVFVSDCGTIAAAVATIIAALCCQYNITSSAAVEASTACAPITAVNISMTVVFLHQVLPLPGWLVVLMSISNLPPAPPPAPAVAIRYGV